MKTFILLCTISLLTITFSCGQVKPGVYYVEYINEKQSLSIDSLSADGKSKFSAYSDDGSCIVIEINSNWEFKDGIIRYSNNREKQRTECNEDFHLIETIDFLSYKITDIGKGYFIGQSIEDPDVVMKWTKKK